MTVAPHDAGSITVEELTSDESARLFERRCREELDVAAEEFLAAHDAGEYPESWDVAAISRIEFLLPYVR